MGRKRKQVPNNDVKRSKPSKILTSRLVMLNFKVEDYVYHHKPLPLDEVTSYLQELECYRETCSLDVRTEQVISKLVHSMKNIIFETNEKEKVQTTHKSNAGTQLQELKLVSPIKKGPTYNNDLDETISIADSTSTNCEITALDSPKTELADAVARINIEIGSPSILSEKPTDTYLNTTKAIEASPVYNVEIITNTERVISISPLKQNTVSKPKRKIKGIEDKGVTKAKRQRKVNPPKEKKPPAKRNYTRKRNSKKNKETKKAETNSYWLEGLQYIRQVDASEESKPVWLTPGFWNDVSFPPDWDSNDFIY